MAHSIDDSTLTSKTGRTSAAVAEALGFSDRTRQKIFIRGVYAQARNSVAMGAVARLNTGKVPITKAHGFVRASLKLPETRATSLA